MALKFEPLPAGMLIDLEMLYPWFTRDVSDKFDHWAAKYAPDGHITIFKTDDACVNLHWFTYEPSFVTIPMAQYNSVGKRLESSKHDNAEEIAPYLYLPRKMKVAHTGLLKEIDRVIRKNLTPLSIQLMGEL
jgi:hypothetical protein